MLTSEKLVDLNLSELNNSQARKIDGGNKDDSQCTGGTIDPSDPDTWGSTGPFNPCEDN